MSKGVGLDDILNFCVNGWVNSMNDETHRIELQGTKLDTPQVDGLFAAVMAAGASICSEKFLIDLSTHTFVNPAGMTGVALAVRVLRERGWSPVVLFPTSDQAAGYLCYMGVDTVLKDMAECRNADGPKHAGSSDVLLELTKIEKSADVEGIRREIHDRVTAILRNQLKYKEKDVQAFAGVISELAQNIVDHSAGIGYVAAQTYRSAQGRFVYLSVADSGIGLRNSLAERFPQAANWEDTEVIVNAMRPEFSRFANRGLGLTFVRKVCLDFKGTLQIRTGRTRLYLRAAKVHPFTGDAFPGTQVAISFFQ